jgi:hypothetical protein
MRRLHPMLGTVVFAATLAHAGGAAAQGASGTPTFTKDVAPIVFQKCAVCHRPGEVAPMSLLSYDEARPWAKAMKSRVVARQMPPWDADPAASLKFKNERWLAQKEIDTISAWADAGAPRGNAADLPAPPTFVEGWSNPAGEPDAVLELPANHAIVPEGELPYVQFYVKIPWAEDRFASAIESRPSNRAVVHHSTSRIADLPKGHTLNENGQAVSSDGVVMTGNLGGDEVTLQWATADLAPNMVQPGGILIGWVPGRGVQRYPDGVARRIPAGKYVSINNHYQTTGKPEVERTKLGFWWNKTPVKRETYMAFVSDWMIAEGRQLVTPAADLESPEGTRVRGDRIPNIPPYADNFRVSGVMSVREDVTVYSLIPHMHFRGKDLKFWVTYPDGRNQTLLTVPRYDFNWQIYHELEQPLKVPAGSKITAVGHYDNSPRNRYNPAPEKEVFWSEQSWDEMFSPWVEYTIDGQDLTRTPAPTAAQQEEHYR